MSSPEDCNCAGTVLAVDDCPAMREILRAALECLGYSVQAVDSGWAALDAVADTSFDAIVLDVEMPGLDGMAVGRALRSTPRAATAAIAMHSSVAEEEVRAGFDEYDLYVPKGADPRRLGEQVDRLIRSRRMASRAPAAPAARARLLSAD
jgi:CheY-like chemotaxis protein